MEKSGEGMEALEAWHREQGTELVNYSCVNQYLCTILKMHQQQVDAGTTSVHKSQVTYFVTRYAQIG